MINVRAVHAIGMGLGLLVSQNTIAGGEAANVRIVSISTSSNLGNHVFIRASSPPNTPASCSGHNFWHFTLSLDTAWGKNAYAMLLTAKTSATPVHLSGTNACSEYVNVESLRSLTVYE